MCAALFLGPDLILPVSYAIIYQFILYMELGKCLP
jgi:hypothetical protein